MKYIVAAADSGFTVMERQQVGDHEVYVRYCSADRAAEAARIAEALNGADRGSRTHPALPQP